MVIAGAPPGGPPVDDLLVLRVDHDAEVARALATLERSATLRGLHLFHADADHVWDVFRAGHVFVAAAGGAVTDEQGRLLAIRRLGVWDLPKGKIDPGESVAGAAIREVQEECGLREVRITGELPSTWHTYERKGKQHLKRTDWFLMRASSDEVLVPQTDEGIEEVRWLDPGEVRTIEADTYPSLLPVFRAWWAMRI